MIELLTKNQVDSIISLQNESNFADGWNKDMWLSAFNSKDFIVFGLIEDGVLIGYISFNLSFDTADLELVIIRPDFRSRGLSKLLMEFGESSLKTLGVTKILLEVRENNLVAKNLYSAFNYQTINVRKKYYPDGENAVIMAKELK